MKQTLLLAAFFAVGLAGCAHKPAAPESETTVQTVAPKKAEAPVKVTQVAPTNDLASSELEKVLKTTRVQFDFNSDRLKPESMQALQRVGEVLKKHAPLKIRIEGNCDERGTEEYNLILGERRASVAKAYLIAMGAVEPQVETISYGALRPVNPAHHEGAWSENRRDDLQPKN